MRSTFALLAATSIIAAAAEPVALSVGQTSKVDPVPVSISGPENDTLVWTHEFQFELADLQSFAFKIDDLTVPESAVFALQVYDQDLSVVQNWDQRQLANRPFLWSAPIVGPFAFLALQIENLDEGDILSFEINEIVREEISDAELESIVGERNFQHMYEFVEDDVIMNAGRSVAKLSFVRKGVWHTCTGFMVSDDLLLTNEHCVNSQDGCYSATAVFGFEWERSPESPTGFELNPGRSFACEKFLFSDYAADWSLVRLTGNPGSSTMFGHLSFSGMPASAEADLVMIQHPAGYPKIVTRKDCRVSTPRAVGRSPARETDFGHVCDSIKGSSGAPLVNSDGIVLGQHHWGFDRDDPVWSAENRAVHVTELCLPETGGGDLPDWPACR